ncbi:Methylthioribulose-1-phosphate dehydratase [Chionoecetes opilio]|uniref:Probable methylthioribulose-1-phosphate dehydratase n=1 Tax=Chionoecetes opilio TaxID=41210 RepID=A0A8J4XPE4_CHIOP|nr:Methylthioribulose-1-phosphate dehydratase [Chionoecetes opilio]
MSDEESSTLSKEEEEEPAKKPRGRGRPKGSTGRHHKAQDTSLLTSEKRNRKRTSRFLEDFELEEEVPESSGGRKRGRPKGHTRESGTWVARKPLGRPRLSGRPQGGEQSVPEVICELGQVFYAQGWVSGTGGGISIRDGESIYIAPSGVQKERLQPDDLFVINLEGEELEAPLSDPLLRKSQCTPLFLLAYKIRNAGAVIHSHSKNAVLATLAFPGSEFTVTHLEMIKRREKNSFIPAVAGNLLATSQQKASQPCLMSGIGIKKASENRQMQYDEKLVVPIIENTPFEHDLSDSMAQAIELYPDTNAVLVRRHGLYVWGDTWQHAKTMGECYDYLFDVAVQMVKMKLDPSKPPKIQEQVNGME